MVMQAAFFKLANVISVDDAIRYLKDSIQKIYGKKGSNIVEMNKKAVDRGVEALQQVKIPADWADIEDEAMPIKDEPDFIKRIQRPMAAHEGDNLPTSAFVGMEDGTHPLGTTAYEKRGIAVYLPEWQIDKCIQCNQCSYVCPHATIRPFLLDEKELTKAPDTFKTKKPVNKKLADYHYRIQIAPLDCTGCGNCADICPAPGKALVMKPADHEIEMESENWEFAMKVTEKHDLMDVKTLFGSQLARPLLEFNGACPGCGETPYAKLITQLYGERMLIANATGCSSIWGGSSPSIPYTTNATGKGPAWMNPLFEDNAEFGYGLYIGSKHIRAKIAQLMRQALESPISENLRQAFQQWLDNMDDGEGSKKAGAQVLAAMEKENIAGNQLLTDIVALKDYLIKPSVWIFGGDGFAYDIGYNGLDHVIAMGDDVNILIMDTEFYSNTGGQSSKATQTAAIAKFAAAGKQIRKKDLGLMATTYGYVYVAQIAMGSNMNQTIKAITEAESYKGPSLIIAYASCVNHGIKSGMGTSIYEMKKAVEAGYWHLWRYDPRLKEQGKNPFILDSKAPTASFQDFIKGEIRYSSLQTMFPEAASEMFTLAEKHAQEKYQNLKRLAEMQY
ncbi:Pyruvate synthase [bioreactor metagenome]|uniref:Pyruvate synthase n=1 Tax=bioreactor metagenome TaxID=1076179 RepID=A0A644ZTM5_9ZZZZ